MSQICGYFGISRQAHYQHQSRNEKRADKEAQIVIMVQEIRHHHPRMGGRKVLHKIQPLLSQKGLCIGRDAFFDLLARHDLLIPQKRQKRRTTFSGLWRCPNRLNDLEPSQPGQAWVSDLTYLETESGFCYLALVTDIFSRFIVGFDVSTSLAVEGAMAALNQAIAQAP
jgi:transposase InsO family protein